MICCLSVRKCCDQPVVYIHRLSDTLLLNGATAASVHFTKTLGLRERPKREDQVLVTNNKGEGNECALASWICTSWDSCLEPAGLESHVSLGSHSLAQGNISSKSRSCCFRKGINLSLFFLTARKSPPVEIKLLRPQHVIGSLPGNVLGVHRIAAWIIWTMSSRPTLILCIMSTCLILVKGDWQASVWYVEWDCPLVALGRKKGRPAQGRKFA